MSDTPTPPQPAVQDTWTLRVTTLTAAIAFLAGIAALIYVMVLGDAQISTVAMGFVGGLVAGGGGYFMRGRVENPTQTRTGTGDGGSGGSPVNVTSGGPTTIQTDETPTPAKP